MKDNLVILLAPDSFKESMTAKEVCLAMERGIKKVDKNIECIHMPMADGGEGTMETLVDATGGKIYRTEVLDPLGRKVLASYGILGDGQSGVIEMASASGIHLLKREERNPLLTTTYGTGQLIKKILDHRIEKLLIGIGGSATNDGGVGAIQALGGRFLDKSGREIPFGGGSLGEIVSIDLSGLDKRLKDIEIEVACDVDNPLYGQRGASHVFGPQKGATREMVEALDKNLLHYGNVVRDKLGINILDVEGAGAAGGLGGGLMAFLNGKLKRGIDLVIKYSKIEEKIALVDMVWTGEGSIDFQTQYGKTPIGVAGLAKKYNKPLIALAGRIGKDIDILYDLGLDAIFCINNDFTSLEEALLKAKENTELVSENIIRLIKTVDF